MMSQLNTNKLQDIIKFDGKIPQNSIIVTAQVIQFEKTAEPQHGLSSNFKGVYFHTENY